MSKQIKVIVVDPHFNLIHIKTIEDSLAGLQGAIDDHHIEAVYLEGGDMMYCDSEGLFRDNQAYFVVNGKERSIPLAGKSIILGYNNEGGNEDVNMSIMDAGKIISFHTREEMFFLSQAGKI